MDEKKTVLQQLENKSSREAEKTLLQMSSAPEQLQPEKIKPIDAEFTQVRFNANSEFMALLEEARGLLGNSCRSCNRLHAVQSYGRGHVLKHLSDLKN